MVNYIIIVTGTPGTGKSILSRRVALEFNCISLEDSSLFKSGGALVEDPTGRETSVIVESKAIKTIEDYVNNLKDNCLVVSTLNPSLWLNTVGDYIPLIILLRCDPRVLIVRLEDRGWSRAKIIENTIAEAFNIIAEEIIEGSWSSMTIELDTTHGEPRVEELISRIESWDTGINIDWLSIDPNIIEFTTRLIHELDLYKGRFWI